EPLDSRFDESDIAPETRAAMHRDCWTFLRDNAEHIRKGWPTFKNEHGQAAHDFWLTRNGHGAGFWDGDWPEPHATKLSEAAQAFGTFDLYVGDDGRLYHV